MSGLSNSHSFVCNNECYAWQGDLSVMCFHITLSPGALMTIGRHRLLFQRGFNCCFQFDENKTLKNFGKYRLSFCHSNGIIVTVLLRVRPSREKRVSASCRPFRFFPWRVSTRLCTGRNFVKILYGRLLMNICRENSNFLKIAQKCRAQYFKT
jgi:hypothetical protein